MLDIPSGSTKCVQIIDEYKLTTLLESDSYLPALELSASLPGHTTDILIW